MILAVYSRDWAAHLAPHYLPFCLHSWDSLLHPWLAHLNNSTWSLPPSLFSLHLLTFAVSPSLSSPLIPTWAQLWPFSSRWAPERWRWKFFSCEVPVRGLHYTLLKQTLFDLTWCYFEGPSLKRSHHWPLGPSLSLLLIVWDQKREKNM